jgi:outer membrane biosynthesis protein TonB
LMTSGRPVPVGRAPIGAAGILRTLAVVLVLLGSAMAVPAAAIAAEPTSSYGPEPPKQAVPSPEPPKPQPAEPSAPTVRVSKEGTSPSKEVQKSELPEQGVSASHQEAAPRKADTLPFTGFDLRRQLGLGMLLIIAGSALLSAQCRRARDRRR